MLFAKAIVSFFSGHAHPYAHVSVRLEDLGNFVESSTEPFTGVEGAYSLKEYLKVCPNDPIVQHSPLANMDYCGMQLLRSMDCGNGNSMWVQEAI